MFAGAARISDTATVATNLSRRFSISIAHWLMGSRGRAGIVVEPEQKRQPVEFRWSQSSQPLPTPG